MKLTILIDNHEHSDLAGEWGLSVCIEYDGKKYLLDSGASGLFADNADRLGIDLSQIDAAILSHAHFDHSDGMDVFFDRNPKASFCLRQGCGEDCYSEREGAPEYIGIHKGWLDQYRDRIIYADGAFELAPGVKLLPHTTPGLEKIAKMVGMFRLKDGKRIPEDFCHEQSLVFETERGLVIMNSCSHGGADNIISEVMEAYPGRQVYALIGGLHLFTSSDERVQALADRIDDLGLQVLVTGHCTGDRAMELLKARLGERVTEMYSGYTLEI